MAGGEEANEVILEADAESNCLLKLYLWLGAKKPMKLYLWPCLGPENFSNQGRSKHSRVFRPKEFFEPRPQQKSCVG